MRLSLARSARGGSSGARRAALLHRRSLLWSWRAAGAPSSPGRPAGSSGRPAGRLGAPRPAPGPLHSAAVCLFMLDRCVYLGGAVCPSDSGCHSQSGESNFHMSYFCLFLCKDFTLDLSYVIIGFNGKRHLSHFPRDGFASEDPEGRFLKKIAMNS